MPVVPEAEYSALIRRLKALERQVGEMRVQQAPYLSKGCRVHRTDSTAVITGGAAWASIEWQAEEFDRGGFWDVANPTRLTAPWDGYYLVMASWDTYKQNVFGADFELGLLIAKSGSTATTYKGSGGKAHPHSDGTYASVRTGVLMIPMAAGDWLTIMAAHTLGAEDLRLWHPNMNASIYKLP